MNAIQEPVFDIREAIRHKQERDAVKAAVAFSRDGLAHIGAPPGSMKGFGALQARILDAIEAGADDYTDAISVLSGVFNQLAGMLGYAGASLPDGYGAHLPTLWNEVGGRATKTFKACITHVVAIKEEEAKKAAEKSQT